PAEAASQERGHGTADVLRFPYPPQGGLTGEEGVDVAVVAHVATAEVRLDGTGRNDVHRDATRAEFLREIPREHFHPALHRCIRAVAGIGEACQPRGNVEDASALGDVR